MPVDEQRRPDSLKDGDAIADVTRVILEDDEEPADATESTEAEATPKAL